MPDILVTTPRFLMTEAAQEAADCIREGGGSYFRVLATLPRALKAGTGRVFYVEDGHVRGYAQVTGIGTDEEMGCVGRVCDTTGRLWRGRCIVYMDAASWTWIDPVPYKGFQGWRYFDARAAGVRTVGGWRNPKPEVPARA